VLYVTCVDPRHVGSNSWLHSSSYLKVKTLVVKQTLVASPKTPKLSFRRKKANEMGSDSEAEKAQQKEKERKKLLAIAPIAKPLAGKKLCKRTLKLVRRGKIHIF
jgi:hypothetical protein